MSWQQGYESIKETETQEWTIEYLGWTTIKISIEHYM